MATNLRARPADTPHFHATHCSGERMPAPDHASVSSTWPMRPTNRPPATLRMPHTSAISSSRTAASSSRDSTPALIGL
jgi:hypothetical protein